jgi:Type IV secretion-system coupling protein DNA-binding domain/HNH endonuclease
MDESPEEIDDRVADTEVANFIDWSAAPQRVGVLASLSKVAKSLRLLPHKDAGNGEWSATEWSETRRGWIFITSLPAEREALRPLQSVWIDMLVLRLMNQPKADQKRVWFVLDELASLQRLPQLHTAITENRKSNNPIIMGFQGKAQLEVIYGHLAEVMLSQPATSIYLKTKEPNAGEWVSKAIGKVEIERMKETHFDGTRSGRNFALDRQVEPVVMESEISGLPDLHAFMKYENYVTGFSFPYFDLVGNEVSLGEISHMLRNSLPVHLPTASLAWHTVPFRNHGALPGRSTVKLGGNRVPHKLEKTDMNLGMPSVDWEVRVRDKCACSYCGVSGLHKFDIWLNLGIDHVVPSVHGGDETADNKVVACFECNCLKGKYSPTGNNRKERVADGCRHVQASRDTWRERFEMMMEQINKTLLTRTNSC